MLVFWKASVMNYVNSEILVMKFNLESYFPRKILTIIYNNEFTYGTSTLLLVFSAFLPFTRKEKANSK